MTLKKNTDVLIIGGGIIGMSVAYFAIKEGLSVAVLERGEAAQGTSSRCDGNILVIDKDPGFDSLMSVESQRIIASLAKSLPQRFEYRAPGSIFVCETEEEMEAARDWVSRQAALGLPFRMLDRSDIRQESRYFADDLPGGLECASDSTVNPYSLTYALAEEAERLGARVHLHTTVQSIAPVEGGYSVETDKGSWLTSKIVNAAGCWAPMIGRMVGLEIPVFPRKGHLIVASRGQPVGIRKVMEFGYLMSKFGGSRKVDPMTEKYGVALVFEPTESQNFLIGSSREFVGFDTSVRPEVISCMARRAIRFYPAMADFQLIRTYAGLRPWTPDHLPIVSEVDGLPGFFIAAGHEGDGISLAAVTGKLMGELLTGAATTCIPAAPLRFDRFNDKKEDIGYESHSGVPYH
ncbi:FAD-binding oxidoreductase [Cohnella endophytica]|uniref:FAD-binding oxidoreductase n=1 Tax=Cohnella endophytica TaxID=2419778 RepID=A0A494Y2K3_9BACL|nr:FAD-dependent oxidoreductase [Cohnella endophytica]RKP54106.1 FAD-binding oxidoreductase [Cohnella endophytica]